MSLYGWSKSNKMGQFMLADLGPIAILLAFCLLLKIESQYNDLQSVL